MYGPMKANARIIVRNDRNDVPRVALGWAYTWEFLKEYAEKSHVELELPSGHADMTKTGWVTYGKMSDEELENEELMAFVNSPVTVRLAVRDHFKQKLGIYLNNIRPFTDKYDRMWVLYTNEDAKERRAAIERAGGLKPIVQFMNDAMSQGGHRSLLLWWYQWENLGVVRPAPGLSAGDNSLNMGA